MKRNKKDLALAIKATISSIRRRTKEENEEKNGPNEIHLSLVRIYFILAAFDQT